MRTTLLPFIYLWSLSTGVGGGQTSGSLVGSSSFERRGPPKWTVSFLKLARVWFISLTWSYSLTIDWRTFEWGQKIRNVYGFKNITKINFQKESGSILQIHSLSLSFSHMKRKNLHHKLSSNRASQNMAVALRAGNSLNIYMIKVIFRSSDFMEGYSLKCQLFSPLTFVMMRQ